MVFVCGAIDVVGNVIPPMMICSRKTFKPFLLDIDPLSNWYSKHFWMDDSRKKNPEFHSTMLNMICQVLLLLDNYHEYIGARNLNFAKENGKVMLFSRLFPQTATVG